MKQLSMCKKWLAAASAMMLAFGCQCQTSNNSSPCAPPPKPDCNTCPKPEPKKPDCCSKNSATEELSSPHQQASVQKAAEPVAEPVAEQSKAPAPENISGNIVEKKSEAIQTETAVEIKEAAAPAPVAAPSISIQTDIEAAPALVSAETAQK